MQHMQHIFDIEHKRGGGGVSYVPFSFQLLFQLLCELCTKFRNQFTISSKYLDMTCYSKQETYYGPISFEVQQNDI